MTRLPTKAYMETTDQAIEATILDNTPGVPVGLKERALSAVMQLCSSIATASRALETGGVSIGEQIAFIATEDNTIGAVVVPKKQAVEATPTDHPYFEAVQRAVTYTDQPPFLRVLYIEDDGENIQFVAMRTIIGTQSGGEA